MATRNSTDASRGKRSKPRETDNLVISTDAETRRDLATDALAKLEQLFAALAHQSERDCDSSILEPLIILAVAKRGVALAGAGYSALTDDAAKADDLAKVVHHG